VQPAVPHYIDVMDARARTLADLQSILREVGSEHALVGGLVAGFYGRPRATIDVDLLVPKNKLSKIAAALEQRGYRIVRTEDMVRVFPSDLEAEEAIADLVARAANPVLRAAFDETDDAVVLGEKVRVVRRGAFVALEFHAAMSRSRAHADRLQDVVDIERVIKRQFDATDRKLALRIAALSFPNADRDLEQLLDDLDAGRPVTI